MKKGEVMLLEDHINLQGDSPLAVKGITALGERFVDMSMPYDKDYRQFCKKIYILLIILTIHRVSSKLYRHYIGI